MTEIGMYLLAALIIVIAIVGLIAVYSNWKGGPED